jgi:hypothetical protein
MDKDIIKSLFKSIGYTYCEKVCGMVAFFHRSAKGKLFNSWEEAEKFLKESGVVNG